MGWRSVVVVCALAGCNSNVPTASEESSSSSASSGGNAPTLDSASTIGDTTSGNGSSSSMDEATVSTGRTATTPTSEETSDTLDTVSGFIPASALGNGVFECSLWSQDCPPGFKCRAYSNDGSLELDAVKCVPVDPDPVGIGEPCIGDAQAGIDNCEPAAICSNFNNGPTADECVPMCLGSPASPHCEDPTRTCIVNASGTLPQAFECPEPGQVCAPYFAPGTAPPGTERVGWCSS